MHGDMTLLVIFIYGTGIIVGVPWIIGFITILKWLYKKII